MAETSWRHSPQSLHVPGMFADVSIVFPVLSSSWGTGFRGDIFQLISKWLEVAGTDWLALQDIWEYCPTPILPKFCQR